MIDRFDMEKYLGEGWKEFRDGEQWSDVGVLKEMLDKKKIFLDFEKWCFDKWIDRFLNSDDNNEPTFVSWLFTPERFCKLVIEFLEEEKLNEQAKTS